MMALHVHDMYMAPIRTVLQLEQKNAYQVVCSRYGTTRTGGLIDYVNRYVHSSISAPSVASLTTEHAMKFTATYVKAWKQVRTFRSLTDAGANTVGEVQKYSECAAFCVSLETVGRGSFDASSSHHTADQCDCASCRSETLQNGVDLDLPRIYSNYDDASLEFCCFDGCDTSTMPAWASSFITPESINSAVKTATGLF